MTFKSNILAFYHPDHSKALEMGQSLIDKHFSHSVKKEGEPFRDDDTLYRLLQDDESNALNADVSSECEPRPGRVMEARYCR